MSDNKEKQKRVISNVVRDLNLRLVRPVSINEINELKVLLKKNSKELWKYLRKRD